VGRHVAGAVLKVTAAGSVPKDVVREFVAHVNAAAGDWSLLAPDAIVTVNGTTPLSGRYPGVELIRGILVDTARVVIRSLRIEIDTLIGTGSRVAALLRISGVDRDGLAFNAEGRLCGCVFGVRDRVIDEVVLFPDTSLIETALYRRRYVGDA
jgi:ketosteroid isomerase-like protein